MKKSKILLYASAIMSLVGILLIYKSLPEQIPIHFDYHWEVDQYGHKGITILLGIATVAMVVLLEQTKHRYKRMYADQKNRFYDIVEYITVYLMIFMNWGGILLSKDGTFRMRTVIPMVLGLTLIVLGNYMPKVKKNFFVGIRTPWTLLNEVSWKKTHRVGGYIFVLYGVMLLLSTAMNHTFLHMVTGVVFTVGIVYLFLYSYLVYKREMKKEK